MNLLTDFVPLITIVAAAFFVMLGFFVLALQLFVSLIAFKLGALAAFVALPWGVFSGTAWVAERPLGWVVGCALRLFILAFVASVSITFVDTLPATLTMDAGGALNVLLFGLTVLALAWFAPALASEVGQGQPHLSGADAVRTGVGAGFTAAGGVFVASRSLRAVGGLALGAGRLGARAIDAMRRGGGGAGGGGSGKPRALPNYAAMQPKPPKGPQGGAKP